MHHIIILLGVISLFSIRLQNRPFFIHIFFHKSDICYVQSSTGFMLLYITNELFCIKLVITRLSDTSSDMSRLLEATFYYENMSVLIRKNYFIFKKWGEFIPWRRTIIKNT